MATATTATRAPKEARYFYAIATPDKSEGEILHDACETFDDADWRHRSDDTIRRCRFEPLETKQRFRITHMMWGSEIAKCPTPHSPLELPLLRHIYRERIHDDYELLDRAAGLAEVARRNRANLDEQDDSFFFKWFVLIELGKPLPGTLIEVNASVGRIGCETRTASYPVRIVNPTEDEIAREQIAHRLESRNRLLSPPRADEKPAAKKRPAKRKAK